jgi:cleavage and polyadenylation specificity factor subunit 3
LQPKEITALSGRKLPLACEVKLVSFTAHSDFPGTFSYIRQLAPRHTVFVHGEQTEMKRLFDELRRKFEQERAEGAMDFCMPENGAVMRFVFNEERVIKTLGRLADKRARWESAPVAGLLVAGDFDDKLVAPDELEVFTQLSTTIVAQRLHVPFHSHFSRLQAFVRGPAAASRLGNGA